MTTEQYRKRSGFSIFLSFFKPHRGLFFLDMACALVVSMIDLAYPIISRYAMRTLLPQSAYRTFFTIMLIVLAAYALRSVLYFIITYWGHTFGIRVEADIRAALFGHMQELGFEFFDRNRTGQLMSRMTTDLFEITELAHHGPEDLFISLVTIVGALAVMFRIEWRMAIIVMAIIPVFLVVLVLLRGGMSRASVAAKQKTGAINAEIESGLSGVRTTKAFANEDAQQERFDEANEVFKTAKRGFHKEMGRFNAVMEFCTGILPVAVIAVGGWLIMGEKMDYVDLITFSLYVTAFVSPIRKLANFAEMFSNGFAGLHRFIELMATEPSIQDAPDARPLEHVQGRVDVNDVSFAYGEKAEVLHNVTLHIPVGETVALVGPSGGGKSTIANLLTRFWDVKDGRVLDTSMGFTPLAGILMGTRCGDIDPAIVPFIMKKENMTPDEVSDFMNKKCGFLGLSLVELLNIFLHGGLVCRREISGDNVARRPCPGGRAVLRSRDREHVPALGGHKHRFRRGAVRSNREQVRSLWQYGAVNDVYGRTRRRQRAGERSLRGVGLRRVHCH